MTSPFEKNRRIIVIDDTEAIHADIRKTLAFEDDLPSLADEEAILFGSKEKTKAERFTIDSALQGQEGFVMVSRAAQEGNPYAMAFVDMRMPPGWDGVQTIKHLWQSDPNLQVVICTAYSDYSWDQIVQQLGATDRLLILKKPFDSAEVCQLASALTEKWQLGRCAKLRLDELEKLVEERTATLLRIVTHDQLTGLGNRILLAEWLGRAINRGKDAEFALLFLDFDRFKIINDSLGHEAGDNLLKDIAERLKAVLGGDFEKSEGNSGHLAARFGGDEFVIFLEGPGSAAAARDFADRLLADLRNPYQLDGHQVYSTASIGITTSRMGYTDVNAAIRDADIAMYQAKSGGKDRHVFFDPAMHEEIQARLSLESDLRRALKQNEFFLQYQPIVSTESGRLLGFEALARWKHPLRGMVPPAVFIPVAEETGLIIELGHWVMRTACEQLNAWHEKYPAASPLYVSVNLSKRQMLEPDLLNRVARVLKETGINPIDLKLEVTESVIMERADLVAPLLTKLKELGVGLFMDDFGTGQSSLTCLHQFPLDTLKIDRAFLCNLENNREYSAIIQAIVTLAQNLGMGVIAEGIETPEQLVQVQALDCLMAQGYLFSRPMSSKDCEAILEKMTFSHAERAPAVPA